MKTQRHVAIPAAILLVTSLLCAGAHAEADDAPSAPEALSWPPVARECKPWTYWWWLASAVNPEDLTWNLEQYRQAGMGGMHIVPIFGGALRVPKGYEDQYIDYLSPKWMAMWAHTVREAERLDMGIDMTTGTAWNFGGPHVPAEDANVYVTRKTYRLQAGARLEEKLTKDTMQALVAYSDQGQILDLTEKI